MIFGKTSEERHEESYIWRRWFAWFPVELEDTRIAWLSWIERRVRAVVPYGELFEYYDYRSKP